MVSGYKPSLFLKMTDEIYIEVERKPFSIRVETCPQ